jgi:hypothetical protein
MLISKTPFHSGPCVEDNEAHIKFQELAHAFIVLCLARPDLAAIFAASAARALYGIAASHGITPEHVNLPTKLPS